MLSLLVSVRIKPAMREQFLKAIEDDARCSVRDEPGCLRFDVLADDADPAHFFFYEVYKDEKALDAHRASPHYARWREASEQVLAEPTQRTVCRPAVFTGAS
jgi:(4S)-4-hydroxy-5-phosphonooxypentane-2,3-dione isomerase